MQLLARSFVGLMKIVVFINTFGGIIAGIWLAIAGDWWAIGYGLMGLFAAHWVISLLLVPGLIVGAAGARLAERGRWGSARIVLALSSLYTTALMFAWCLSTTLAFLRHAREAPIFPMFLWAYGVATSPWMFLAAKDQEGSGGNEFSLFSLFAMQAGYVLGAAGFFATGSGLWFVFTLAGALVLNWLFMVLSISNAQEG